MAAGWTSHMCIRVPLIHVNGGMDGGPERMSQN
jgi:hypothetical protein